MKILIALTYYRPHVSGLTIYVERLARALANRGHAVTILTSQYDRRLPREEPIDGVRVLRVPVLFRVSKGVIMPTIGYEATREVKAHDVLSIHLPQFDAAGIAFRARVSGKPAVLTYHCDLRMPSGPFNLIVNQVIHIANRIAAAFSDAVVAYTKDYAIHSPFLSRYLGKLHVIPPPVEVSSIDDRDVEAFKQRYVKGKGPVIGMAARLATEKGVEYLAEAFGLILKEYPDAQVLFAGQYKNVLGEAKYAHQLQPWLDRYREKWTFLGVLNPAEMTAFYRACDLTVLPSVNSTESFGLVQIESMICGVPVVASDLPGVRQPILTTGMGRIAPIRNSQALANEILRILKEPDKYQKNSAQIADMFSPQATAERYERLFEDLLAKKAKEDDNG